MNLDDKFKKIKELMDAGAIKIPNFADLPSVEEQVEKFNAMTLEEQLKTFNTDLSDTALLNELMKCEVAEFDNASRDGYKLNLLTGKFYKP